MWKMFLDDMRMPAQVGLQNNEFFIVRSFKEAVDAIKERGTCPSYIAFDHDLAEEHYGGDFSRHETGFDFARWLIERDIDEGGNFIPKDFAYSIHSMNPYGAEDIRAIMHNWLVNIKPTYWDK